MGMTVVVVVFVAHLVAGGYLLRHKHMVDGPIVIAAGIIEFIYGLSRVR